MVKPGDVFAAKLPHGRYKAVRVIRKDGKLSLVNTSEYLGEERPNLDEPLLRKTVVQRRFFSKDSLRDPGPKVTLHRPPPNFELLGNIPPTKREAAVEGSSYRESVGDEAFLEWRWLQDRAARILTVPLDAVTKLSQMRPAGEKHSIC